MQKRLDWQALRTCDALVEHAIAAGAYSEALDDRSCIASVRVSSRVFPKGARMRPEDMLVRLAERPRLAPPGFGLAYRVDPPPNRGPLRAQGPREPLDHARMPLPAALAQNRRAGRGRPAVAATASRVAGAGDLGPGGARVVSPCPNARRAREETRAIPLGEPAGRRLVPTPGGLAAPDGAPAPGAAR